jgi:phage repressor protein C with HTH and peptisase S24 domain
MLLDQNGETRTFPAGDSAREVAERSDAAADQPPQTVEEQAAVVRNAPEEVRSVFERTRTLTIYTEAKADCGEGRVIFEEGSKIEVTIPTTLFERLMGVRLPPVIGAMFCTGDSMEPVFEEEDLLFYHPTREIDGAGNYAVMVDERLMAKRIQPLPGRGVRLISENKRAGYQDFDLVPPEGDEANGLIFEKTNQQVDFWPAGRIFWPRRETSRMHISQVKELIGSLMETGGGQRVA